MMSVYNWRWNVGNDVVGECHIFYLLVGVLDGVGDV